MNWLTAAKRKKIITGVILAVLIGGGLYWYTGAAGAPKRDVLVPITVTRGTVEALVTAQGKLEAKQYVDVGTQVSGQLKAIPDLPIVALAEDEKELGVIGQKSELPEMKSKFEKADLLRWNDYGIGLFLQGDLKSAEYVFQRVTEIDPGYVDGWVNVGRVRVQEGNTAGAQEVLKKALDLDSELAKAHYFYALTLKTQGKYDEALEHLHKALSKYPRDRVVRNQAGRIRFLKRQYPEAIQEFHEALKVDPEDLQAHYNLMLCYQGLGNSEMADRERNLYLRFKADESSQFITGPVRLRHPAANNERQPIHEHVSVPLDIPSKAPEGKGKSIVKTYAVRVTGATEPQPKNATEARRHRETRLGRR